MEQEFVMPKDVDKSDLETRSGGSSKNSLAKWKRRRNLLLLLPEYFDLRAAVRFTELLNVSGGTISNDVKWLYNEGYLVKPQRGYYKKVKSSRLP